MMGPADRMRRPDGSLVRLRLRCGKVADLGESSTKTASGEGCRKNGKAEEIVERSIVERRTTSRNILIAVRHSPLFSLARAMNK